MISLDDIRAARLRIAPYVRRTPVMPLEALKNQRFSGQVIVKLECLQVTGSFKARGAMNAYLSAAPGAASAGLVTASGGNHGLAVARTAHVAGLPATIFLPSTVPASKIEKLKLWGARTHVIGDVWDASNAAALAFAEQTGALYLHPFAHAPVVAGQGTVALELLEQIPDAGAVVIAIGGGGLIAGMAAALKALKPGIRIIGVEPEGSPTLHASLAAGHVVTLDKVTTRVSTMACRRTDDALFALSQPLIDEVILVSDDAMQEAARWLWFEMGISADLSGAASIAALFSGRIRPDGNAPLAALICGAGPEGTL